MQMIDNKTKSYLEKQHYKVIGSHSAVKLCTWTKKSLRGEDVCYKEKFYGIKSHRCCQMSPCLACTNQCVFCWRELSTPTALEWGWDIDEPEQIIKGCIEKQRKLLEGYKGYPRVNMKRFEEAQNPNQFAISLSGEPTMYSKLKELILELNKKGSTFLVTNGMFPDKLKGLSPTQLYVSVDAPNKKIYSKIDRPGFKDAWERLNKTLEVVSDMSCRRVLRLTLVKGLNMVDEEGYANLIKKAKPDFVEAKAYMWVGSSRQRLTIENMPRHHEIKEFAEKIAKTANLKILDEKEESRVVLLGK